MEVRAGFGMDGDDVGAGFGEGIEKAIDRRNHEVDVERLLGVRAQRFDHRSLDAADRLRMSLSLIPDRGLAVGTQSTGIRTARRRVLACAAFLIVSVLGGCTAPPETSLQRLVEARQRTADLMLHFTTAADAGNRAVLADTDESSAAFAREAAQATEAAEKDAAALAPMFEALDYAEESRLLKEFNTRFAEFRTLDRNVLELAVANTNTKAQQLAFGPAQSSVDELDRALEAVAVASGEPNWRVQALVARTLAAVRAIQLLQAPHIAEATDAAMTRMEAQMAASEKRRERRSRCSRPSLPRRPLRVSPPPLPHWTDSWTSTVRSSPCPGRTRTFDRCR